MKRIAFLLAISLIVVACATAQQPPRTPSSGPCAPSEVPRRCAAVRTVSTKGTVKQWEPEQSKTPGGEMRFANEAHVRRGHRRRQRRSRASTGCASSSIRRPRTFTFTEIVTSDVGYVAGIDSNGRTKQSLDSNPPAHNMSGLRLAATQRELQRNSALLLLDMYREPRGRLQPPQRDGGRHHLSHRRVPRRWWPRDHGGTRK